MDKAVKSIKDAIILCELKDGMTISFHHHLRNGDYLLNMVMEEVANLNLKNIKINASAIFDIHEPLIRHIKQGVVTQIETAYIGATVGSAISKGVLTNPVTFRTHGGRAASIASGESPVDIAFIAAPTSDTMGNCTGKYGKSACGSLGYAFADAMYAKKVVIITDNLVPYPLADFSISEIYADYVVEVPSIGNPSGIVSGTTKITRDPVGLVMASYAVKAIEASGLLKNGMSFQTGAGGASLAAAKYLKELMIEKGIKGSYGIGGITGYLVDMLESNLFETLLDTQCFDLNAVESIRNNPRHREISAIHYASPQVKSSAISNLDVVILGATQIDTDFNVNVHTNSNGYIMGGSGGHSDTAQGAKLTMIIAPLTRARLSIVVDKVLCKSTPGNSIDLLITQHGLAVNPLRSDLKEQLKSFKLPIVEIEDLKRKAEDLTGTPRKILLSDRIVADVFYRDGTLIDQIRGVL